MKPWSGPSVVDCTTGQEVSQPLRALKQRDCQLAQLWGCPNRAVTSPLCVQPRLKPINRLLGRAGCQPSWDLVLACTQPGTVVGKMTRPPLGKCPPNWCFHQEQTLRWASLCPQVSMPPQQWSGVMRAPLAGPGWAHHRARQG